MSACVPALPQPAPSPCSQWRIAGSDSVVSGTVPPGGGTYLTSVVPSGSGALLTWFVANDSSAAWNTRSVNLDGTPRSDIVPHLSFSTKGGVYVDVMSLAAAPPCAFGGLVDDVDAGCRFLPLDGDGHEVGAVVSLPDTANVGCGALGASPQGFSFVEESPGTGLVDLVFVGADGSNGGRVALGALPGVGSRLVLDDDSFLLSSFFENDAGGDLTMVVSHYGARGEALATGTTIATNSGSILLLAETSNGVLASYLGFDPSTHAGQAMYVVPLTRDGAPLAPPRALDVTGAIGPIYAFSLDRAPSGDVILTWTDLDEATDHYRFFAMELDPTGNPRGAPSDLGTYEDVGYVHVVPGDGDHALLVYAGEHAPDGASGVHTLPLACAAH